MTEDRERPSAGPPKKRRPGAAPDASEKPGRGPFGPMTLVFIVLLLLGGYYIFSAPGSHGTQVPYGFFWNELLKDNVKSVQFHGEILTGEWKTVPQSKPEGLTGTLKKEFNTVLLPPYAEDRELAAELKKHGLTSLSAERTSLGPGSELLIWFSVPLLLLLFMFIMMRRTADPFSGGGMMGSFIRSPARRFEKEEGAVTYDDVAGLKTAKQDLQEVVEFLKSPDRFLKLGARIPKGVLLVGPPGTGKTLLARATAGEAGVPFFSINGSEFIQMFVGVGATRVRDLFKTARESAPCIIFIDEIDAVGRVRGAGVGGGHDEREQTLNQILSEMDGFSQSETVIVLAATNRHDVLDPALLRPGRFDRHVTVDRPARDGRLGILKVHVRKVPLADNVSLEDLAQTTMGYSGAELQKLVNEAAIHAARENKKRVEMEDFLFAQDLVLMGARRDEVMDDEEKRLTAWHEAGHAVLAWYQEGMDPVHKVSIIPRGRALGVTQLMPEKEIHNVAEDNLRLRLVMMMGGRAAEKLVFNQYSAGAEDDIERATKLARRMVASWGMSEKVGPVSFKQSEEHPFLGKEMHSYREFSEETARIIDMEVQRIMHEVNSTAIEMLSQHREQLDALAEALLKHENLERSEVEKILGPRPGAKPDNAPEEPSASTASEPPADQNNG
ncbi:MAG: ATP-dependent zinc metalloprotease FtsH [Planctomycetaceae bacterium]